MGLQEACTTEAEVLGEGFASGRSGERTSSVSSSGNDSSESSIASIFSTLPAPPVSSRLKPRKGGTPVPAGQLSRDKPSRPPEGMTRQLRSRKGYEPGRLVIDQTLI